MRNRKSRLAINGGTPVRTAPFPERRLLGEEEKNAVMALFDRAIETGRAFGYQAEEEAAYCREFCALMGGGFADGVNSGTCAIYIALRALDLEPFSEIVVSPITDHGGMMPIVLVNCIPAVADTEPGSFNIGPKQVEEVLTERTSAILVAHIGGEPADIEGLAALARKRNIPLVEDCAQAHGARVNGRPVGSFGDFGAFSTMFGKHHCTGGQGGVVYTGSGDLHWKARRAADRGKAFNLDTPGNVIASLNLNLDELGAAVGRVQLSKLPGIIRRRQEAVEALRAGFGSFEAVFLPEPTPGVEASWWFLRVILDLGRLSCDRDAFCAALEAEGILLEPCFWHVPHTDPWYLERKVCGSGGHPWTNPLYKGDPDRRFPCPNALAALKSQFRFFVNESWGKREVSDILEALRKVEDAYLE